MLRPLLACLMATGCVTSNRTLTDSGLRYLGAPAADYLPHAPPESTGEAKLYEASLAPAVRARMVHDPRLDQVAGALTEHFASRKVGPASDLLQWVTWRSGYPGHCFHSRVWHQSRANVGTLDTDLKREALADEIPAANRAGPIAYGLARIYPSSGGYGQAVVMATRRIEWTALPKSVAPGKPFAIAGRVLEPGEAMTIKYEDGPDNEIAVEVPLSADGKFALELTAPATPGRSLLSIRSLPADTELATFPIYAGIVEPADAEPLLDMEAATAALKAKLIALRAENGQAAGDDPWLNEAVRAAALSVCRDGANPDDHRAIEAVLAPRLPNREVKSQRRSAAGFRLKKDPGVSALAAIVTCEIEHGAHTGQQYVLIVTGTPR